MFRHEYFFLFLLFLLLFLHVSTSFTYIYCQLLMILFVIVLYISLYSLFIRKSAQRKHEQRPALQQQENTGTDRHTDRTYAVGRKT